jgi:multiple sugar transport system permease protein
MGYWMVFFLAGLQDIPPSLYEAAAIDGAGAFQKLWTITLPLMRRVFAFVLAADTAVNFLFFVPIYLLTSGGPQSSTDFLMYETYKTTFVYLDLGHGMALASCLLIIILSIVMAELRLIRA